MASQPFQPLRLVQPLFLVPRRIGRWLFALCCLVLVASTAGCVAPDEPKDELGLLKTKEAGNLLLFSGAKLGVITAKKFLLFNDGRVPVRVEGMTLVGDSSSIFRVQPIPKFPLTLAPGSTNGIGFEVEFLPKSAGTYRASLAFTSPNVENVDDEGYFRVHLYAEVKQGEIGGVNFLCQSGLDFGTLKEGTSSDKSCDLTNQTQEAISLTDLQYKVEKGSSDFNWLNPPLPFALAPGKTITVTIRYKPKGITTSEGVFRIATEPSLPSGILQLKVSGKTDK